MTSKDFLAGLLMGIFDIISTIRAVHSEARHIVHARPLPAHAAALALPVIHPPTHTSSSSEHIQWSLTGQAPSCCSTGKS